MVYLPLLAVVLLVAVGYYVHSRRVRQEQELQDLALLLEDGFVRGRVGLNEQAGVTVEGLLGGRKVLVDIFRKQISETKSDLRVCFEVEAPNSIADFTVRKTNVLNRVGRAVGLVPDTSIDDEVIDQKYILTGQAPSLKQLFRRSPDLEGHLDELFLECGLEEIELLKGKVESDRAFQTTDPTTLHKTLQIMAHIASLCERREVELCVGKQRAFTWGAGGEGPRCPYCRDDLVPSAADVEACPACQTLHHSDCLEEGAGCTVLGCENSRAARRLGA